MIEEPKAKTCIYNLFYEWFTVQWQHLVQCPFDFQKRPPFLFSGAFFSTILLEYGPNIKMWYVHMLKRCSYVSNKYMWYRQLTVVRGDRDKGSIMEVVLGDCY